MFESEDDVTLSCHQICAKHGYPIEQHFIETEDNYILCAFRISGGKGDGPIAIYKNPRPVVIY